MTKPTQKEKDFRILCEAVRKRGIDLWDKFREEDRDRDFPKNDLFTILAYGEKVFSERQIEVWLLRHRERKTFKAIGQIIGVCPDRPRRIVRAMERRMRDYQHRCQNLGAHIETLARNPDSLNVLARIESALRNAKG